MAKEPKTFAAFDVRKDDLTSLISRWREANLFPTLEAKLTGSLAHCDGPATKSAATEWRANDAKGARLLSICSHGSSGSLNGCADAPLYTDGEVAHYEEVPGAIMHLLACESLSQLGPALFDPGQADAVIGYSKVFRAEVPGDQAITPDTKTLPPALQPTIDFDGQILIALARGETVEDAVATALQWATATIAALDKRIAELGGSGSQDPAVEDLVITRGNLDCNRNALGTCGDKDACVT